MINLRSEVQAAIISTNPVAALSKSVKELFDNGIDRQSLVDGLEALRTDPEGPEESLILEVLDYLTGWCRPEFRL